MFTLTAVNASPFWNNPENFKKINDIIVKLHKEVTNIFNTLIVLRAVIITSDVIKEYERLLTDSKRNTTMSKPRTGTIVIAGKIFKWGKCESIENYYAAVILDEHICVGAFENDNECKALIVHELAHVAEWYITKNVKGNKLNDTYNNEWERIKYLKATDMFSEYFAQIMAYPYYPNNDVLQEHVDFIISILKSANQFVNNEITKYRIHADMNKLWTSAGKELSRVFDQVGRSLGLLECIENNNERYNEFLVQINSINPSWVSVIQEAAKALKNFASSDNNFSPDALTKVIEKGFNASGFIPEVITGGKIYIHVPIQ